MRKTYINHKPTPQAIETIGRIRKMADEFHTIIENGQASSRERSLALTHLEEVVMWAVKGIVLNDPASIPEPPK